MRAVMDRGRTKFRGVAGLGLAGAMLLTGCTNVPVGGKGELEDEFFVTVTITNVGNGSGSVDVQFSIGTPQAGCPAVLGPGESCSPSVASLFKVESVSLQVDPAAGSEFVRWDGNCAGTDGDCTIINDSRELDVRFEVDVRFDLAPVGD